MGKKISLVEKYYKKYHGKYKVGQKLQKIFDGRIVEIKKVTNTLIVLDGEFEPNHVVMLDKVDKYYKEQEAIK